MAAIPDGTLQSFRQKKEEVSLDTNRQAAITDGTLQSFRLGARECFNVGSSSCNPGRDASVISTSPDWPRCKIRKDCNPGRDASVISTTKESKHALLEKCCNPGRDASVISTARLIV